MDELKILVKDLYKNGIEVIFDVVFNYIVEGNENGLIIFFWGIDNKIYYMLILEGYYFNFSGCGNIINCNNFIVCNVVLDCLCYWVSEYYIDGFRFDLVLIFGCDFWGVSLVNFLLLEILVFDLILVNCKLIVEVWDVGGLY